jgi:uncharacterized alpha-E superfamily protein
MQPAMLVAKAPLAIGEALDILDAGIGTIAAFNGLMHENMTRNFGWTFLDMGRRLSRGVKLCDLMLSIFGRTESEEVQAGSMQFVLELGDSFITYRSRYRLTPILPLVLDLLLIDETNPRSLAFQLAALSDHVDELPQLGLRAHRTEESRTLLSLLTAVRVAKVGELAEVAADGSRPKLQALLGEQVEGLPHISDGLGRRYFALIEKEPQWVRSGSRIEG